MLEIQEKMLHGAIKTLTLLNCEFAVKMPDGTVAGTLKVETSATRTRLRRRHDFSAYNIPERVDAMKVGDVDVYPCPDPKEREALRNCISAKGCTRFGKGTFTTGVVREEVQCMRTA